ncbi:MAG: protein kinase [Caldithrix sp.]|nr:protein kinase [Caldithrix sp.]
MKTIGNYNILKTISDNGHTKVFLAEHIKLKRKTLLKVFSGGDQQLIRRFEREAQTVADLDSDAVVSIYDFGEIDGQFFISMEYVDGVNLREYLQNHELTIDQIIRFAAQITRCLSIVHEKGYIHRDLKPENILVDVNNRIWLTDFGISLHNAINRFTSDGALLGTPLYMAPEQINNMPISASSDVFALGIILYQMATGVHPFEAEQYGEVFSKILSTEPDQPHSIKSTIPLWFSALLENMLQKDPAKRPQNATDVLKTIENHLSASNYAEPLEKQQTQHRKSKKSRTLIFGVPSLMIIIIIFTYFLLGDFFKETPPMVADSTHSIADSNVVLASNTINADTVSSNSNSDTQPTDTENKISDFQQPLAQNDTLPKTSPETIKQEQPTTLMIKSSPWCNVYLDYKQFEQTPMQKALPVAPGKYILGLRHILYPTYEDTITVLPHKKNVFTYNLDSLFLRLDIGVEPWGRIFIDNKLIGETPLQDPVFVTRDNHIIKIEHDYYGTLTDTIEWTGQNHIKKTFVLENGR